VGWDLCRSVDIDLRVNWLLRERIRADTAACHKAEKPPADRSDLAGSVHALPPPPFRRSPPVSRDPRGPEIEGVDLCDPTSTHSSRYFSGICGVKNGSGRQFEPLLHGPCPAGLRDNGGDQIGCHAHCKAINLGATSSRPHRELSARESGP
jgi:hypothetical protein